MNQTKLDKVQLPTGGIETLGLVGVKQGSPITIQNGMLDVAAGGGGGVEYIHIKRLSSEDTTSATATSSFVNLHFEGYFPRNNQQNILLHPPQQLFGKTTNYGRSLIATVFGGAWVSKAKLIGGGTRTTRHPIFNICTAPIGINLPVTGNDNDYGLVFGNGRTLYIQNKNVSTSNVRHSHFNLFIIYSLGESHES